MWNPEYEYLPHDAVRWLLRKSGVMSRVQADRLSPPPLPVACSLSPSELATKREALLPGLLKRSKGREEVPGGFRWEFAPTADLLSGIASVIDAERSCCSFLRFLLIVEPAGGPVHLEVTGPEGTEEFLDSLTVPGSTADGEKS